MGAKIAWEEQGEKTSLLVTGDANVKGLGLIQDTDIRGQVIVRAGKGLCEAEKLVVNGIYTVKDNKVIVMGFGAEDLGSEDTNKAKQSTRKTVTKCNREGNIVHIGLLKIPPQKHRLQQNEANNINTCSLLFHMEMDSRLQQNEANNINTCSFMFHMEMDSRNNIHMIDCKLKANDIGNNDMHCNYVGKNQDGYSNQAVH